MIPTTTPPNNDYPQFVADQLLMAADLNNVVEYLDEQERLTRTNLIGIGVVCGLEVTVENSGTSIHVSKGCGVTSMGYLVTYSDEVKTAEGKSIRKFTHRQDYKPFEKTKEASFIDGSDAINDDQFYKDLWPQTATETEEKTALYELLTTSDGGATALDKEFLSDKVVLVFVELKKIDHKNCDPQSCDDNGVTIEVNLRFLLIGKDKAAQMLKQSSVTGYTPPTYLKQQPLKRFDVPASVMDESADVMQAYLDIFRESTDGRNPVQQVQQLLSGAYTDIKPLVVDLENNDPFTGLSAKLKFLTDGSLTGSQLLNLQYYHDFLSDLLQAVKELNKTWVQVRGACVPPNGLFPRHLFLGKAFENEAGSTDYRTHFIPSPVLQNQHSLVEELRFLFRRLVLMVKEFEVLAAQTTVSKATAVLTNSLSRIDETIRITPSKLGDVPLSQKAIPFYYRVPAVPPSLWAQWNYHLSRWGIANQNLSYHARAYNGTDEFVREPLLYDLEPYNFLRIEGHVGKDYRSALRSINFYRDNLRLPFNVVALGADFKLIQFLQKLDSAEMFDTVKRLMDKLEVEKADCHFNDLESQYDAVMAELTCVLCNEMKYHYGLTMDEPKDPARKGVPTVTILKDCDPAFRFQEIESVREFEEFYQKARNGPYRDAASFISTYEKLVKTKQEGNIDTLWFGVLYLMDKLYDVFADSLSELDAETFETRSGELEKLAAYLKNVLGDFIFKIKAGTPTSQKDPRELLFYEDIIDHLDVLIQLCRKAAVKSIVTEYRKRFLELFRLRKFGYFARQHPGIQHKAGVPMGGTFILVYHEETTLDEIIEEKEPDIKTQPGDFRITGRLVSPAGAGLPSVQVTASDVNTGAFIRSTLTNAIGSFLLPVNVLPVRLQFQAAGIKTLQMVAEKASLGTIDITKLSAPGKKVSTKERFRPSLDKLIGKREKAEGIDALFANIPEGTVMADFYLPYLCCSDCPPVQFVVREPEAKNQPPVAKAGDDQTLVLPRSETTLDGSASFDPDGTIASFAWVQKSGPMTATITQPSDAKPRITNLRENGTYLFELTVTDNGGLTAKDEVMVIVSPPENQAPVANAGSDRSFPANSTAPLILDGGQSKDPEGATLTYQWKQTKGPGPSSINLIGNLQAAVTNLAPGAYEFTLTVRDNNGAEDSDTVNITVVEPTPTRVCLPVNDILNDFKKLPGINPNAFPRFAAGFASYWQVEQYFGILAQVSNEPVEKQIEFFSADITVTHPATGEKETITIADDLPRWLMEVFNFSHQLDLTRLIALHLYRLLVRLAMYIACIQDEDIDGAKVRMVNVFLEVLPAHFKGLKSSGFFERLNAEEKKVFALLLDDFTDEAKRLDASGEAGKKKTYSASLKQLIEILKEQTEGVNPTSRRHRGRNK